MEEEEEEEDREAGAAGGKVGARAETYDEGTGGYDVSGVFQTTCAALHDLAVADAFDSKHTPDAFVGRAPKEQAVAVVLYGRS
jgi:hypothetical protein